MPEITVYTTNQCQPCKATKRKLKSLGVGDLMLEINAEEDVEAGDYLRELGYTQTPVVMTSYGDEWTGFRPDLLEAFAKRARAGQ